MKKIKLIVCAVLAIVLSAPILSSCSNDDNNGAENIVSEYSLNDKMVADQKAKSGKSEAILLIAFGSTWNNAFQAFDATKAAYEQEFPNADVYVSFSSDICINRASAGENTDDNGNIVKRVTSNDGGEVEDPEEEGDGPEILSSGKDSDVNKD